MSQRVFALYMLSLSEHKVLGLLLGMYNFFQLKDLKSKFLANNFVRKKNMKNYAKIGYWSRTFVLKQSSNSFLTSYDFFITLFTTIYNPSIPQSLLDMERNVKY